MALQRLSSLKFKRLLACLCCFLLGFGFFPRFFFASAASVTDTLTATFSYYPYQGSDGNAHVSSSDHTRSAIFNIDPAGGSITISRGGVLGGATPWWEVACFDQPVDSSSTGYFLAKVTSDATGDIVVTAPPGYSYLLVNGCVNATSSTSITITISYEDTTVPDVPSYDGTTSGSSSVVTGVQQGFQFDGVSIDTTSSQLSASLVEETSIPVDNDEDGIADSYVLKSTYKVPVLVSCVVTNTSDKYAWLNDKTIGYSPQFTSSIPLLADAATTYSLCDIFYTSKGFADAVTSDGTIHFRFDDSNYYLGNVIIKPMSTLSASALLYYDVTVITTVPAQESFYSYLTAVAQIMRTTILNSVGLSGINAIQGMLEYIPTDSTSMGQQQINNSVIVQGQQTQQAINALQTQQQMQYDDFTNPKPDAGNDMVNGGISSVNEKLGIFTAVEGILQNTLGLFNPENVGDTTLTLPAFSMEIQGESYQFWDDQHYNLSALEEPFAPLLTALRLGTSLVVYGALLHYLQKVFEEIIGGNASD